MLALNAEANFLRTMNYTMCAQVFLSEDIMSCVAEFIPHGCILPYLLISRTTLNSWKHLQKYNNIGNNVIKSYVSECCGTVTMLEWAIQANMPITSKKHLLNHVRLGITSVLSY